MTLPGQLAYDNAEPEDFDRDERAEADLNEPDDFADDYAADMTEGRWTAGRRL